MDTPWFLGIDLGTGSCKSIVIDAGINVLGIGYATYPAVKSEDRWQEQNPHGLLEALLASVREAIANSGLSPKACRGISLGGALHTLLALDAGDRPLTGVMTWVDDRAVAQALVAWNASAREQLYTQTGCPVHWIYPLYKIAWLRSEKPEIFQKTRRFVTAKEYVCHWLCGEWVVDLSVASGSGLLNIHTHQWSSAALDFAEIVPQKLSAVGPPSLILGELRPQVARQLGLPAGIPFTLGSSDSANSSLGTGAAQPGEATCMVGTSGAMRLVTSGPVLGAAARNFCYALDKNHWLVGGAINNGGIALAWLQDMLNSAYTERGEGARLTFDAILSLASQVEPGAEGLLCLPFLAGERGPNWSLNTRAAWFGMSLAHDARHLARALLEGIAFHFRSLDEMLAETGQKIRWMRASGGFTRSPFWLQLMADVLGRQLSVPLCGEGSALGAAFWAMGQSGPCGEIEQVNQWVPIGQTFTPDPNRAAIYDRQYRSFDEFYRALPHFSSQLPDRDDL